MMQKVADLETRSWRMGRRQLHLHNYCTPYPLHNKCSSSSKHTAEYIPSPCIDSYKAGTIMAHMTRVLG